MNCYLDVLLSLREIPKRVLVGVFPLAWDNLDLSLIDSASNSSPFVEKEAMRESRWVLINNSMSLERDRPVMEVPIESNCVDSGVDQKVIGLELVSIGK